jgi:putative ATP-binding cassette transporter
VDLPLADSPLLRLLRRGSDRFGTGLLGVTVLSGLASALLLAIINAAAANAASEAANGQYLAYFAIVIVLYVVTQRHILMTSIVEVERILHGIRTRLTEKIRHADLLTLEGVGRADIYAGLNRETVTISQSTPSLVIAGQSALMVLFSVLYLLYLSKVAFILALVMTWIGLSMHFRRAAEFNRAFEAATAKENEFYDVLTHMLDGFKEVKLSEARSADLYDHLSDISVGLEAVKTKTGASFANHFLFAQVAFYLLIASIVFLLPRVSPAYSDVVTRATAAILFIIGPLGGIVNSIPILTRANVASANITRLESAFEAAADEEQRAPHPVRPPGRITMRSVLFQYADERGGFALGPLDMSVAEGEILFIVGGNGSGKSTLLKILTGLYQPMSGLIQMNGSILTRATAAWYRSHFSVVFSDYHLFDRLYGLRNVEPARIEALLKMMEIQDKTEYAAGRFTTTELSSGQKKRLALVAALLEDRPVLVLDEWAADQDPPFRRRFYQEILPRLKAEGKTIVAVTHDDRYFEHADRILKMEYGQFVAYEGA